MVRKLEDLLRGRRSGSVYAGPFLHVAKRARARDVTIRLAKELWDRQRATIAVETRDFRCPPNHQQVKYAMLVATQALADGCNVYCHCSGGIGRTGMFLAVLVAAYQPTVNDPISFVRANYDEAAVETLSQKRWVRDFIRRNRTFFAQLRAMLRGARAKNKRGPKQRR